MLYFENITLCYHKKEVILVGVKLGKGILTDCIIFRIDVKIPEIPIDASSEPTSQPEGMKNTNQSGGNEQVTKSGTSIESKIEIDHTV